MAEVILNAYEKKGEAKVTAVMIGHMVVTSSDYSNDDSKCDFSLLKNYIGKDVTLEVCHEGYSYETYNCKLTGITSIDGVEALMVQTLIKG